MSGNINLGFSPASSASPTPTQLASTPPSTILTISPKKLTLDGRVTMVNGVLNINLENYGLDDIKKQYLNHPVNEAFLTAVWSRIRKWFWLNIAIYAIFLVLLTTSVWLNSAMIDQTFATPPTSSSNLSEPNSTINLPEPNSTQVLLVAFVASFWLLLVVREIAQMWLQRYKISHYLTSDNVLDWILIGVTSTYIVYFVRFLIWEEGNDQSLASSCGAFAVLVGWLNVPFYLSELPLVGTIIHFSYDVLVAIIQMIMVLASPFIIGFGLFLHFEIPSAGSDNWWYHDILRSFSMMLGNLDIKSKLDRARGNHSNELAIGVFMIVMCLVIQNVILSLTVGRLEYFSKSADFIRMRRLLRAFKSFSSLKILKLPNGHWKTLKVSKNDEIRTWQTYFFKTMLKAQSHHYHTSIECRAKLYDKFDREETYYVAIPSWVINKAEKIIIKAEDVEDNQILNTSIAAQKTQVAEMHTILVNQEMQNTQLRTDNQNLTNALTDQKTQIAEMHKILVGFEQSFFARKEKMDENISYPTKSPRGRQSQRKSSFEEFAKENTAEIIFDLNAAF